MKNLKLILAIGTSLIISIGFLGFALWANLANAEFKLAIEKAGTVATKSNQEPPPPSPSASATSTYTLQKGQLVEGDAKQLALEAWNQDKLLPGKDLNYNWVEVTYDIACWDKYFREHGINVDAKAFDEAYEAIVHRSEQRLRERAFQANQE